MNSRITIDVHDLKEYSILFFSHHPQICIETYPTSAIGSGSILIGRDKSSASVKGDPALFVKLQRALILLGKDYKISKSHLPKWW